MVLVTAVRAGKFCLRDAAESPLIDEPRNEFQMMRDSVCSRLYALRQIVAAVQQANARLSLRAFEEFGFSAFSFGLGFLFFPTSGAWRRYHVYRGRNALGDLSGITARSFAGTGSHFGSNSRMK